MINCGECAKREGNDINIAEPCIHKAGVSRIDKMIFSSFNQRYLLFYYSLTRAQQIMCTLYTTGMTIYSCVCQKFLKPMHL